MRFKVSNSLSHFNGARGCMVISNNQVEFIISMWKLFWCFPAVSSKRRTNLSPRGMRVDESASAITMYVRSELADAPLSDNQYISDVPVDQHLFQMQTRSSGARNSIAPS